MKIVGFCKITIFGQTIEIGTPAETPQGTTLEDIKMDIAEAIDIINESTAQFSKAQAEILAKINELQQTKPLTAEQEAIVRALRQKAQAMDDIIPDEVSVPEPEPETPPTEDPNEGAEDGEKSGEG